MTNDLTALRLRALRAAIADLAEAPMDAPAALAELDRALQLLAREARAARAELCMAARREALLEAR